MQIILYTEINAFALVVLLLIFLNVHRRSEKFLPEQKLFFALICANGLILVLDTLMWILDGKSGAAARLINQVITAGYYTLNPTICMIWAFYADFQIYRSVRHLKRLASWMVLPVAAVFILSLASISKGYFFFIDANNVYHRGSYFLVMAAISYFYLVYTFVVILAKQDRIQKRSLIPMMLFAVPPFIGGIVQTFLYGISLIWVCVTISILIIFINIQNDQLFKDYLTGLYNRRHLENYLGQLANGQKDCLIAGIMMDLNMFKRINDVFGHDEGDRALRETAALLEKSFRNVDFIARYGGDEFVVIMEIKDPSDLFRAVDRLKANIAQFNEQKSLPYAISLSYGYDCYECKSDVPMQQFIRRIDELMYRDKQKRESGTHEEERVAFYSQAIEVS
jgi:diguanylate cyclase (GGDEF)-like protein